METGLTVIEKQNHQLPAITCKLNTDEQYFFKLDQYYTIKQYEDLKLFDPNSAYKGEELARYHIGNALEIMYGLLGVAQKNFPSKDLARRIAKFIQRTYTYISPKEIFESVEFALQDKFSRKRKDGTDILTHYQVVDLKFISDILNEYVKWRYSKKIDLENKIERETKILTSKNPDYLTVMARFQKDDAAAKDCLVKAFDEYKSGSENWNRWINPSWFEWVRDLIELPDREQLNERFRYLKSIKFRTTDDDLKIEVKYWAIEKGFESIKDKEDPLEILNRISYLSYGALEWYHSTK
jgi:hypothetical protein